MCSLMKSLYGNGPMKRLVLAGFCFILASGLSLAQNYVEALLQEPHKAACTFYVYDYGDTPAVSPAPEGYSPFYISHFARHGARYCTSEYGHLYKWFSKASSAGMLTDVGKEFFSRYSSFYQKIRYCEGNLTGVGKAQHRAIAEHMYGRFPEVFEGPTRIEAVSTESPRVIMSMWSCLQQLVALDEDLSVEADASARFAPWLQPRLSSNPYLIKEGFSVGKATEDAVLSYFENTVPWRQIAEKFFLTADVLETVLKVTPEKFIGVLHGVVAGTYCLDEDRGCFDDVFSEEESRLVWKGLSARYFVDNADFEGSENMTLDYAAFTLGQIIESADADIASGGTQLRLRFGHDSGIAPLMVLLGLDGFGRTATSFDEALEIFPSYSVPMGATVQFVFYRNVGGEILVKVLLNEKEASLPFDSVEGKCYKWKDFKEYYLPRISDSKDKIAKKLAEQESESVRVSYGPWDSLAFVNASWAVTELAKGAKAMYAQVPMFNSVQSISAVKYPAAEFRTEILHRPKETSGTPSEIGKEIGASFVMNAGYFNVKELVPCVFYRQNRRILGYTHPTELYRVDGVFGFKDKDGHKMVVRHCPDTLDYLSVSRKLKSVMASGPLLILDGKIVVPEIMGDKADGDNVAAMEAEARHGSKIRSHYTSAQFYDRRHPRTVIGSDDSGNIYLVVIDGRFKGSADGASIYETAYICRLLGMTDAINLDGGGSSALWTEQTGVISHPRDNKKFDHAGERSIPNLIAVY